MSQEPSAPFAGRVMPDDTTSGASSAPGAPAGQAAQATSGPPPAGTTPTGTGSPAAADPPTGPSRSPAEPPAGWPTAPVPRVYLPQGTLPSTTWRADPARAPQAAPVPQAPAPQVPIHAHRRPRPRRRWPVVLLGLTTVLVLGAAGYLLRTTQAWEQRADEYLAASLGIGDDLATTRAELAGVQAELEAVRSQLATAQARIVELADEKAQLGDDREVQRQLIDYQERVTEAAGRVALALDECVRGQNQLIGYMGNAEQYDPIELDQYATSVQALCQTATDANASLQSELSR